MSRGPYGRVSAHRGRCLSEPECATAGAADRSPGRFLSFTTNSSEEKPKMKVNRGREEGRPSVQRTETVTGEMWGDPLLSSDDVLINSVFFAPRARTHWHRHEGAQVVAHHSRQGLRANGRWRNGTCSGWRYCVLPRRGKSTGTEPRKTRSWSTPRSRWERPSGSSQCRTSSTTRRALRSLGCPGCAAHILGGKHGSAQRR